MDHWTRVGCGNLPESRKPGLLPNVARGRAAVRLIEREKISLFAFQEGGTYLAHACAEHPYLNIVRATPNENREGHERGNGFVFDRREWHFEKKRDLTIRIPDGRPPRLSKTETRPINQARMQFTHIPSGRLVRAWSVHKPRDIRGYQESRGHLDGRLAGVSEYWEDNDLLGLWMGDFNGAPSQAEGMRRRASFGPDSIVVRERAWDHDIEWRGVEWHPLPKISDHRMAVSVELNIPSPRKGHGLPRPA